jgi:hypothetical protein
MSHFFTKKVFKITQNVITHIGPWRGYEGGEEDVLNHPSEGINFFNWKL